MPIFKQLIVIDSLLPYLLALILCRVSIIIVKYGGVKLQIADAYLIRCDIISYIQVLFDPFNHTHVASQRFNDFVGAYLHKVLCIRLFLGKCLVGIVEVNEVHVGLNFPELFNLNLSVVQDLIGKERRIQKRVRSVVESGV